MERHSLDSPLDTEKLLRNVDPSSKDPDHKSRQIVRYRYGILALFALLFMTNLAWWTQYWQARRMESSIEYTSSPSDLVYCKSQPNSHCIKRSSRLNVTNAVLEEDDPEHVLVPFEHDWQDLELLDEGGQDGYRYADIQ
jgi:hypothetical protein